MTEEHEIQPEPPDTPAESEELLTLSEAVEFLGTSKPTMYRWLERGDVKGLKVGKQWRFRKRDLVAYMERTPVAVTAPAAALDAEIEYFAGELQRVGAALPEASGDLITDSERKIDLLSREIITLAIHLEASDIHLEPTRQGSEASLLLRIRIDGLLHETRRLPMSLHEALSLTFRRLANVDLSERRLPQNGRIVVTCDGKEYDLRLACLPSLFGESQVMRILVKAAMSPLDLDKLGLAERELEQIRSMMRQPNGMLLASGGTGSGRTTLLYSSLQESVDVGKKTVTVEEIAEHVMPYATQFQANPKTGLTLPVALRAVMRHDPDVILIEEIRDLEIAQIAQSMALTGHLVLAQFYAHSAADAVKRLAEMGLEPAVITTTLLGIVYQRLVRRICEHCKEAYEPRASDPVWSFLQERAAVDGYEMPEEVTLYRGRGCERCGRRGYRGRIGLFEVLPMDTWLAQAIMRGASAEEITELAVEKSVQTLLADGVRKAVEGVTTIDEVLRVTSARF